MWSEPLGQIGGWVLVERGLAEPWNICLKKGIRCQHGFW
jgi:hypothetical protein